LRYKGKEKMYQEAVEAFEKMKEATNSEYQIADFVSRMVRDGLYSKEKYYSKIDWYLKKHKTDSIPGIIESIKIDGLNAIKYYSMQLGGMVNGGFEHGLSHYAFFELVDEDMLVKSPGEITELLRSENNKNINAYLNFIERCELEKKNKKRTSFDEIKKYYENGQFYPVSNWLRKATAEEIQSLSNLYLGLKDRNLKSKLLSCFSKTKIEINEEYLWNELKKTRDLYYAASIINALINFKNKKIKQFIDKYYTEETRLASLKAFICFIEEKDRNILENELNNLKVHEIHSILTSIIECEEMKKISFYPNILRILYEKNECSLCRKVIIKEMIEIDCLEDNLLTEIEYDCNKSIRQLAKEYKSKKTAPNRTVYAPLPSVAPGFRSPRSAAPPTFLQAR
jgi:hypothetical protein